MVLRGGAAIVFLPGCWPVCALGGLQLIKSKGSPIEATLQIRLHCLSPSLPDLCRGCISLSTDPYNADVLSRDLPPVVDGLPEQDRENVMDE